MTEVKSKLKNSEVNGYYIGGDYCDRAILHHIFEAQVRNHSEEIAIIYESGSMTYREINEYSNQLARTLCRRGVGTEDIVAVFMERSIEMYISILAILKAGGAYLPITTEHPLERIQYMLSNSNTRIILSKKNLIEKFNFQDNSIDVEDPVSYHPNKENLNIPCFPSNLAYIIYTSGSTGMPKGVMVEHASVANRIHWMQKAYPIGSLDVIIQKTPITFDVSVWELFWWFFNGSKLFLMKAGAEKNVEAIVEAIEQYNISTIHFVPSMFNIFLDYISIRNCLGRVASLRQVFCSGEALNSGSVEKFNRLIHCQGKPLLINLYGPTEATVDVTHYNCTGILNPEMIPIGKPIDNIQIYIVDANNQLCDIGCSGELCISGIGVARGYVNAPELTREKFAEAPFAEGERIYRTGDIARWMPDGNIEYLGRIDQQVKIRGYRIELSEIEHQILKNPSIKDAVVLDKCIDDGQKILVAYIVFYQKISILEIKRYLQKSLPDYMIPVNYVVLESLPHNLNGKTDRKCLREMYQ